MSINEQEHAPCTTLSLLNELKHANVLRALDYHFSQFLFRLEPEPLLALMGALISYEASLGNTCFDLNTLEKTTLFQLPEERHQQLIKSIPSSVETWPTLLQTYSSVGDGQQPTPMVLCHNKLYLHRYWCYETTVVHWLQKQKYDAGNIADRRDILNQLFPEASTTIDCDWQKVAVALAVSTTFTLISGGPGTGKTTTVAKLIALLIELSVKNGHSLSIELAAPTGKAAARLSESIRNVCHSLNSPKHIKRLMPNKARTLHQLLGARPGSTHYKHHAENLLHMDVLIVDEASMVDLTMMARLLLALPTRTKLILLGDRNQLASVEAGCVLGDICTFADTSYDPHVLQDLQKMTGERIPSISPPTVKSHTTLNNHLCLLKKSFRFKEDSGIKHLAKAINAGNHQAVMKVWEAPFTDITLHQTMQDHTTQLLNLAVQGYTPYLKAVSEGKDAEEIHTLFNRFQVLCALRSGARGVEGINTIIQKKLAQEGLLKITESLWYTGRPVIITRNDHTLELYNGDIGITLLDHEKKLRVSFIMPDGQIKMLLPNRLPEHESVFAMTVHKSQGSEFDHTVIVLPESPSPLLTRELLYTGVTRAKKKLDILADPRLIHFAVKRRTQRASGIAERLTSPSDEMKRARIC